MPDPAGTHQPVAAASRCLFVGRLLAALPPSTSTSERLLALLIAERSGADGTARITQQQMADLAGLLRSTVSELIAASTVIERAGRGAYRLNLGLPEVSEIPTQAAREVSDNPTLAPAEVSEIPTQRNVGNPDTSLPRCSEVSEIPTQHFEPGKKKRSPHTPLKEKPLVLTPSINVRSGGGHAHVGVRATREATTAAAGDLDSVSRQHVEVVATSKPEEPAPPPAEPDPLTPEEARARLRRSGYTWLSRADLDGDRPVDYIENGRRYAASLDKFFHTVLGRNRVPFATISRRIRAHDTGILVIALTLASYAPSPGIALIDSIIARLEAQRDGRPSKDQLAPDSVRRMIGVDDDRYDDRYDDDDEAGGDGHRAPASVRQMYAHLR